MHDSLAQVLGVTHLRLIALQSKTARLVPADEDAATVAAHAGVAPAQAAAICSELDELAELTEEAYRDVREAILGLREGSRVDRSLTDGLRAFLEKYSHQSGIPTTLENRLSGEPLLSPRSEVQIIRVIQEALTNARKHSGASRAVVRISNGDDWTTFTIEDDGRGFDLGGTLLDRDSGFGLHTMRERMELVGGTLDIDSARGRGTRVIARLPAVPVASAAGVIQHEVAV
jgi:two-component system nitrate/nitrite sensor histidine kinase NarX